jgi:peptide/nickel transport system permease protein
LFIVSLLAFLAFQIIPGDPATHLLGTEATPERVAALREQMGLNRPVLVRYFSWLKEFLFGDMGTSYSYSMSVRDMLASKLPVTAALTVLSLLLITVFSIPLGIWQGRHAGRLPDISATVVGQLLMSVPPFFLGIVFTLVFGLVFQVFTPGEYISYTDSVSGFLRCLIFPALAIAIPKIAMTAKLLRTAILGEVREEYVRTARSHGRSYRSALYTHVLRNALIPVITFLAQTIADIAAGSIIIEQVFSIPGMGRLLLASISNRDYPVVQAIVVIMAFLVVFVNFLVDVLYQLIDPRIRVS